MSVLHEVWKRTVPGVVEARYRSIYHNLMVLRERGYLPLSADRVVDAGSGSGAGTIALKDLYPTAEIIAVDDASTQQHKPAYRKQPLPRWTDITEISADITSEDFSLPPCDIVLASRFPIPLPEEVPWREENIIIAKRVLTLARLVNPTGRLVIGYNPQEDGYPPTLREVQSIIDFSRLFRQTRVERIRFHDDWLVLQGRLSQELPPPVEILTDHGNSTRGPFRL